MRAGPAATRYRRERCRRLTWINCVAGNGRGPPKRALALCGASQTGTPQFYGKVGAVRSDNDRSVQVLVDGGIDIGLATGTAEDAGAVAAVAASGDGVIRRRERRNRRKLVAVMMAETAMAALATDVDTVAAVAAGGGSVGRGGVIAQCKNLAVSAVTARPPLTPVPPAPL